LEGRGSSWGVRETQQPGGLCGGGNGPARGAAGGVGQKRPPNRRQQYDGGCDARRGCVGGTCVVLAWCGVLLSPSQTCAAQRQYGVQKDGRYKGTMRGACVKAVSRQRKTKS
jgi:hypothetical protein